MNMRSPTYRIGVILAAGRGRRMGGAKQIAHWTSAAGANPLVAAAYDAIRPACDEMIVVLGHEAEVVAAALGERQFQSVDADPDAPMFESIRAGLRAARILDPGATVVLQPGDHPEVSPATLNTLVDWSLRQPAKAVIPQYRDAGGHPALIPPIVVAKLIEADCPEGLGEFWISHPELCHRVPVNDASVIRDVDTPGDLA